MTVDYPSLLLSSLSLLQDFSLDPDIHRMHTAAHHMVRHLTSGMALITCREPLLISISTALKTSFISALRVSQLAATTAIAAAAVLCLKLRIVELISVCLSSVLFWLVVIFVYIRTCTWYIGQYRATVLM